MILLVINLDKETINKHLVSRPFRQRVTVIAGALPWWRAARVASGLRVRARSVLRVAFESLLISSFRGNLVLCFIFLIFISFNAFLHLFNASAEWCRCLHLWYKRLIHIITIWMKFMPHFKFAINCACYQILWKK